MKSRKQQHPQFKERSFGISVGSVLLLIAAVLVWRGRITTAQVVGGIGAVLLLLGLTNPVLLKWPSAVWWKLAMALGYEYMVTEATNQWTGAAFEALGGVRVHFYPFQGQPAVRKSAEPLEGVVVAGDHDGVGIEAQVPPHHRVAVRRLRLGDEPVEQDVVGLGCLACAHRRAPTARTGRPSITAPRSGAAPANPSVMPGIASPACLPTASPRSAGAASSATSVR